MILNDLAELTGEPVSAYRLINSKFPPIGLFDDAEEFEALYQIQALTNPRLQNDHLPIRHSPSNHRGHQGEYTEKATRIRTGPA